MLPCRSSKMGRWSFSPQTIQVTTHSVVILHHAKNRCVPGWTPVGDGLLVWLHLRRSITIWLWHSQFAMKDPPFLIGKPSINHLWMGHLYHGELFSNQRVFLDGIIIWSVGELHGRDPWTSCFNGTGQHGEYHRWNATFSIATYGICQRHCYPFVVPQPLDCFGQLRIDRLTNPKVSRRILRDVKRKSSKNGVSDLGKSYHWIGSRDNLQETMVFTIEYRGFLYISP